jgi:hypothetical protein
MAGPKAWTYSEASAAAAWARRLLWADAALAAAAVALTLLRGLDPWRAGPADAAIGIAQLIVFIACALVTLRWLYLANANARALGADDLMGSPGLAVGWFFIPLANLFMPYMTVRDTWKASANPRDWQGASAPGAIVLWWILWLVGNVAGTISFRLWLEKASGSAGEIFSLVSSLAAIPAALILAWMIGRIQAMQENARLKVALA